MRLERESNDCCRQKPIMVPKRLAQKRQDDVRNLGSMIGSILPCRVQPNTDLSVTVYKAYLLDGEVIRPQNQSILDI